MNDRESEWYFVLQFAPVIRHTYWQSATVDENPGSNRSRRPRPSMVVNTFLSPCEPEETDRLESVRPSLLLCIMMNITITIIMMMGVTTGRHRVVYSVPVHHSGGLLVVFWCCVVENVENVGDVGDVSGHPGCILHVSVPALSSDRAMGDEGDRTEENIRLLEGLVADVVRGRVAAEWDGHAMELVRVESSRVVSSRVVSTGLDSTGLFSTGSTRWVCCHPA